MTNFSNHSLPINTRLQSLDYLGSVAAQLRKDTIDNDVLNSKENQDKLDQIVHKVIIYKIQIRLFNIIIIRF